MSALTKSYKQDKVQGNFDAIIIGSGLGGLTTAAFLAKEGKKRLLAAEFLRGTALPAQTRLG